MVLHTRGRVGSRLFLERSPSREIPRGFFVYGANGANGANRANRANGQMGQMGFMRVMAADGEAQGTAAEGEAQR